MSKSVRRVVVGTVVAVAAVVLAACGTSAKPAPSASASAVVVKVGKPVVSHVKVAQWVAESIPASQAKLGSPVACDSFGQVDSRLCDAWNRLSAQEKDVLSGSSPAASYTVSVRIMTPTFAVVKWCQKTSSAGIGHGGAYWVPVEQAQVLQNGTWNWIQSHGANTPAVYGDFSCKALLGS